MEYVRKKEISSSIHLFYLDLKDMFPSIGKFIYLTEKNSFLNQVMDLLKCIM